MEEKITIMRYNKPVAVLVPYSQYEKERDHPALEVVMQIEREPQATVTISLIRYLRLIQLETKVCWMDPEYSKQPVEGGILKKTCGCK